MNTEDKNNLIKKIIELVNEDFTPDEALYLMGLIYKDKEYDSLTLPTPDTIKVPVTEPEKSDPYIMPNYPYPWPVTYPTYPLPWWEQNKIWCSTNTSESKCNCHQ